ncbi:MAG: leucyl aminopeptidase [Steroidobacteraceae bacterium]|jgi:leucyl aminopeptidase|nr:leucyl aminopeptidase [Steroidobacteraceae bacterium]
MEFHATTAPAGAQRTGCAVVGVYEGGELSAAAQALDAAAGGLISRVIRRGDFSGKAGESLPIADLGGGKVERALLVGLGPRKEYSRKSLRRAATAAAEWLKKSGARDAVLYVAGEQPAGVDAYHASRLSALAVASAFYRIPDLKSGKKPPAPKLAKLGVAINERGEAALARRGLAEAGGIARGMALSRDLANLPANVCTPTYLATRARGLARTHRTLRVRILEARDMKRLGMGSLLSVTQGSDQPPKLIVLEYRGGKAGRAPVALVGKGVTFDTGGISLKQPPGMDEMKFDMSGAASVFGAIEAIASMKAPVNVVGIVPACENMPSGRATKPGDVFTSMSGKTIEVLNTDAEGRLILCDAITYARRYKPRAVVDIATLTGACVIALGAHYSGLFSPDAGLRRELEHAGERTDDPAWPMPVAEEYADLLKSNFADLANVAGREAGAITAACFLWRFADGLRWAHLDVAGTAYLTGARKGSTGRPVPLLVDWLLAQA